MDRNSNRTVLPDWRRFPVGTEVGPKGSVHARVWAPGKKSVELVVEAAGPHHGGAYPLEAEELGYFSALIDGVPAGTRYRFRLDGGGAFPDPVSRYQPDGPHGPSQVIDPAEYAWADGDWKGTSVTGQV